MTSTPLLAEFAAGYPFEFDDYQIHACQALESGSGVLLAAPTGAGKTVVGEFATFLALRSERKCFYTTPIKALSNQKYSDLATRYGADRVGLLTGDNTINGAAPVVVMTTEVLRNMLYTGSQTLRDLGWVVMDEVHFLADRLRGAVWEEVIIHLPESVTLVSLSATVSNTEEFGDWLVTVRGHTAVVVDEVRPVPLWQHMMVGRGLYDLFDPSSAARQGGSGPRPQVNPALEREVRERMRREDLVGQVQGRDRTRGRGTGSRDPRRRPPSRPDVVGRLEREGLLPAIYFVFSRAGCDAAVQQCLRSGLRLITQQESAQVREIVDRRCAAIPSQDLAVLRFWEWREALERGLAAHHAGMLPTFKEVVEELFTKGLVRAVFATETLALGINMPARTVVLERMVKWNGEAHMPVTAGEYTQLTGRAGRRGIDVEGHAVVVWTPEVDPKRVAGLASTRTYPLRSSFRPSYNMTVNLVGAVGRENARTLLESSLAQFQADRAVVGLAQQVKHNLAELDGLTEAMVCHLGDFAGYAQLRQEISDREVRLARERKSRSRAETVASLERLRPGDVIRIPSGRRAGPAVVLDPGLQTAGDPRPLVLTEQRWSGRLSPSDFSRPVEALSRLRVSRRFNHRNPKERRDLASSLRNLQLPPRSADRRRGRSRSGASDDEVLTRLRDQLRAHPCHGCPEREEHARYAERWIRLRRDTDAVERKVQGRTASLARTFDRVCAVLDERGYLSGDALTEDGVGLSRIWTENDLLTAECISAGIWDGLSAAELASAVSVLVYESRTGMAAVEIRRPPVRRAVLETQRLWSELAAQESAAGLSLTRRPDSGFAEVVLRWADGRDLEESLAAGADVDSEISAGDFVRWSRQVVDLLDQIAVATARVEPTSRLSATARSSVEAVRRGVVAMSPLED